MPALRAMAFGQVLKCLGNYFRLALFGQLGKQFGDLLFACLFFDHHLLVMDVFLVSKEKLETPLEETQKPKETYCFLNNYCGRGFAHKGSESFLIACWMARWSGKKGTSMPCVLAKARVLGLISLF